MESALAELDELVGLEPVKRQVHEIVAQLRVARLRDRQGLASQPPARHFVFTGPPGTGKTTVARILGRIFAALGLLVRPEVVEAHRADLVGEHLGSTAIKTDKLIDSALGGVLFIDEAYSLYNEGYSGGDAYGSEAMATLLKRAEDDRDRLVIVLAGYTGGHGSFPAQQPRAGLAVHGPGLVPQLHPGRAGPDRPSYAEQAGDIVRPGRAARARADLPDAVDQRRIDELGNGRFARSLFERACAAVTCGSLISARPLPPPISPRSPPRTSTPPSAGSPVTTAASPAAGTGEIHRPRADHPVPPSAWRCRCRHP